MLNEDTVGQYLIILGKKKVYGNTPVTSASNLRNFR